MAINQRSREQVKTFKGQQSGLPVEAYGFDAATQAQNFFLKEGALVRTNGGTVYQTVLDAEIGGVSSLHYFKNLWLAQRGFALCLETAEGNKTFSTIFSALDYTDRMYSSFWRDRVFLANSKETKFILNRKDGFLDPDAEAADWGMDPVDEQEFTNVMSVAASETDIGAGGEITSGRYGYVITVIDSNTNSESPGCGAVVSIDGLFELSLNAREANGTNFGPGTFDVLIATGPSSITIDNSLFSNYLLGLKDLNPRITHFSLYRAKFDDDTGLYSSPFAVPNTNQGSKPTITNIDQFVQDGDDFIDNTAQTELPAIGLPENNSPPPTIARLKLARDKFASVGADTVTDPFALSENSGIRQSRVFRDQVFVVGAKSTGWNRASVMFPTYNDTGRNAFSSILLGSEVYQPDYFPYLWEVGRGDGQDAVGVGVMGDTALMVFKENSTYYLSGSSPSDYTMRILDTNKGCLSVGSIQETPFGIITLDRSGFVLFSKIAIGDRISVQIQDLIDSILFEYAATFYSWYDNKAHRYSCAVVTAGSQVPNITLTLDLDSMEWTYTQGQEGLSRVADTNSLGEGVDLSGMADNGRLIDLADETISTFQGAAIESIWTSGTISFGDDQHKKRMRWLYLKVRAAGSWAITIEIIPDFDEARKFSVSVGYDSVQGTWFSGDAATDGSLIWDEGVWAFDGAEKAQVKVPIVSKGRLFQVRIINRDTAANRSGFTLEGISAEATMLGK